MSASKDRKIREMHAEIERLTAEREALREAFGATPTAWLYALEYGSSVADRKVSLWRLRYPFGVCGADYLRVNDDGVSYVRETPLYQTPKEPSNG